MKFLQFYLYGCFPVIVICCILGDRTIAPSSVASTVESPSSEVQNQTQQNKGVNRQNSGGGRRPQHYDGGRGSYDHRGGRGAPRGAPGFRGLSSN